MIPEWLASLGPLAGTVIVVWLFINDSKKREEAYRAFASVRDETYRESVKTLDDAYRDSAKACHEIQRDAIAVIAKNTEMFGEVKATLSAMNRGSIEP